MSKGLKQSLVPLLIVAIVFGIYFLSNSHPLQWYKHYVYEAQGFLHGRTYLQGFPSYYQDLVNYHGKYYLPSPPVPALVLLPAVAIWGTGTDEVRICMLMAAVGVALLWILLGRMQITGWKRLLLTVLFAFGTVYWDVATTGTMWFFAEIVAVFFLLLSLIEYFGKRRAALTGLLLGLSVLSRLPVVMASVFFLAMLYKEAGLRRCFQFAVGLAVPLACYGWFNWQRFGNPIVTGYAGHAYAAYFAADIQQYGMWSLHYVTKQLYTLFLMSPQYIPYAPWLKPLPDGMSILLTTPAVFYALKAKFSDCINLWSGLAIIGVLLPTLFWFSTGWVQFGYRYSLDFMPFLIILIASGMGKTMNRTMLVLVGLSVAVNLWGTLWSVHLGW